jgi:hypothetical protein
MYAVVWAQAVRPVEVSPDSGTTLTAMPGRAWPPRATRSFPDVVPLQWRPSNRGSSFSDTRPRVTNASAARARREPMTASAKDEERQGDQEAGVNREVSNEGIVAPENARRSETGSSKSGVQVSAHSVAAMGSKLPRGLRSCSPSRTR